MAVVSEAVLFVQTLAPATRGYIKLFPNPLPSPELHAPASIAAVYTARDFQDAVHAGMRDIEIHVHLDLRGPYMRVTSLPAISSFF